MSEGLTIEAALQVRAAARRLRDAGDLDAAQDMLCAALDRAPRNGLLHFELAQARLQAGRFAEAWPHFEGRRVVLPSNALAPLAGPEWMGEPIAGARVAVLGEQGLGDHMMFGRYLQSLEARGAEVVVVLTLGNLMTLFEASGRRTELLGASAHDVDLWTYFGSLPLRLDEPAPPAARYLDFPLSQGGGIGVCATGSPLHWNDRLRSLPPALDSRLTRLGRDLRPHATGLQTMLETARLMAGLDLVITVDTAVAHLALAMGKPTWVLLPYDGLDFRWGDGATSPWYPQARLFRQTVSGDWEGVLAAVEAALADGRHGASRD